MSEFQRKSIDQTVDAVVADMAERGWSHLETGINPADALAIRALFSSLSDCLTVNKAVEPEITEIAPRDNTRTLARTTKGMSFHTDTAYLDEPCRSIALFCAVQAEEGGGNQLVDGLEIARALPEDVRAALAERKWRWKHSATRESSGEFAVLGDNEEMLRWWRMSLLNKAMADIAIADTFEEAINGSDKHHTLRMKPGDVLVTNNTRILHNRAAFVGERQVHRARFW